MILLFVSILFLGKRFSENPKYSSFLPLLEKELEKYPKFKREQAVFFLVFGYKCETEAGYIPAEEVYHNGVGDIENSIFLGNFFYYESQNLIAEEEEKKQFESLLQEYLSLRKLHFDTLLADKPQEAKKILYQLRSIQTQIFTQFEPETFEYPTQVVFDFQSDTHALLREWNKCYEQHRTYYHQLADQDHYEAAIPQASIALEIAQVMQAYFYTEITQIGWNMHIGTHSNNIAFYLHCLGRNEEALPEIQKAILYDDEDAIFYHTQAEILLDLQRYTEALQSIEKAIELEDSEDKQVFRKEIVQKLT